MPRFTSESVEEPPLSPPRQHHPRVWSLRASTINSVRSAKSEKPEANARSEEQLTPNLRPRPFTYSSTRSRQSSKRNNSNQSYHTAVVHDPRVDTTNNEEPDFVKEERAAWSRRSPKQNNRLRQEDLGQSRVNSSNTFTDETLFEIDGAKRSSVIRNRESGQQRKRVTLRPFEPLNKAVNTDARPGTSHGPRPGILGWQDDKLSTNTEASRLAEDLRSRPSRRSRFLEGSMNERSNAIASTWSQGDLDSLDGTSVHTDNESTPRPSRESCTRMAPEDGIAQSRSEATPASSKKRIFRFRSTANPSEDTSKDVTASAKKSKKGLRKSISSWNLHNLGEKMRIFGGSTNDLTPKAAVKTQSLTLDDAEMLNERKRKAEEAYATQFGLKKRKSNFGLVGTKSSMDLSERAPATSTAQNRRSVSGDHAYKTTSTRSRHKGAGPSYDEAEIHQDHSSSHHMGLRKRPSRKDLEEENRHLRQLLREQENRSFSSNVSLQVTAELLRQRDDNEAVTTSAVPKKIELETDVPLVPTLAPPAPATNRAALRDLGNMRASGPPQSAVASSNSLRSKRSTVQGRPVSMILEEEDEARSELPRVESQMAANGGRWEWPEDVF